MTAASLAIPIFRSGLSSLATTFRPNADTLSATAIVASIASGRGLSALTILWLADIAELLTAYTMGRTRRAIRDMLSVGEEVVWRLREDGTEERVDLDQLHADDQIMVHTGEKISVDGVVESGEAAVDQASITGEYMPLRKTDGDQVFAGTVVKSGRLVIRAVKVGDQTAVARIVHMVEEATHRKANIQTIADRFSAQFIPVNFLLALIVYLVTGKSSRALNMLIIDYSCGIRLSTATALSAAICSAARNGILIKGSNYLEMLAEADTLIFDKTGTMTVGRPEVINVIPMKADVLVRDVLQYAAQPKRRARIRWRQPSWKKCVATAGRYRCTTIPRCIQPVALRRKWTAGSFAWEAAASCRKTPSNWPRPRRPSIAWSARARTSCTSPRVANCWVCWASKTPCGRT